MFLFTFWFKIIKKFSKWIITMIVFGFLISALIKYGVFTYTGGFPWISLNEEGIQLMFSNIGNDIIKFLNNVVNYIVDFIDNFSTKIDSMFK